MTSVLEPNLANNSPLMPPPGLSGHGLPDLEKEKALFSRYTRKQLPDLTFEFTRDPGLLHQYYRVRADEYNAVYGTLDYPKDETECDRSGHIMVVRRGNFCVGGARLNIKSPRKPDLLPMEIDNFRIENYFSQLMNKQASYCQLSGFSLLEEFRGGDITRQVGKRIVGKCLAANINMLFAVCPILNARLYQKIFITKIHYDIELPVYHELKEMGMLYLCSIALQERQSSFIKSAEELSNTQGSYNDFESEVIL